MFRIITSLTMALLFSSSAQAYHFLQWGQLYISGTDNDDVIVIEVIRPRLNQLATIGSLGDFSDRTEFDWRPGAAPTERAQVRFTITDVRGTVIETASFDRDDVDWLNVHGKDGNDFIYNETALPSNMSGGRGSDVLSGGSGPDDMDGDSPLTNKDWDDPDILFGNGGNDTLIGGGSGLGFLSLVPVPAPDELYGGPGEDTIYGQIGAGLFIGDGAVPNDLLDGGEDKDTYHYFNWDFLAEFNKFGLFVTPEGTNGFLQANIVYE